MHRVWIVVKPALDAGRQDMFEEASRAGRRPHAFLSAREVQVLQLVAAAASNKHIAKELKLSVHTVKRHVTRIMTKLRADSRAEAAAAYRAMQMHAASAAPPAPSLLTDEFTAREMDVIAHVVRGHSNVQIAVELAVSVNTVKRHTANILDKLGVRSRIEAAAIAEAQLASPA